MNTFKRAADIGATALAAALSITAGAAAGANPKASCVGIGASSAAGSPGTTAEIITAFKTFDDSLGAFLNAKAQAHADGFDGCWGFLFR